MSIENAEAQMKDKAGKTMEWGRLNFTTRDWNNVDTIDFPRTAWIRRRVFVESSLFTFLCTNYHSVPASLWLSHV